MLGYLFNNLKYYLLHYKMKYLKFLDIFIPYFNSIYIISILLDNISIYFISFLFFHNKQLNNNNKILYLDIFLLYF